MHPSSSSRPAKSYFLRWMGYILLAGGTAHFIGVAALYLDRGLPTFDRLGYIIMIGVIQLAVGLIDLLSHKLRGAGSELAVSSHLIAVLLITGYAIAILPSYPDFSLLFKFAPPSYLLYHWYVLVRLRADSRPLL